MCGTQGEMTECYGEVQLALQPGIRGTRAFTKHMGLRPELMIYRAGTHLWVGGMGGDRPVFAVPAEVPEGTKSVQTGP